MTKYKKRNLSVTKVSMIHWNVENQFHCHQAGFPITWKSRKDAWNHFFFYIFELQILKSYNKKFVKKKYHHHHNHNYCYQLHHHPPHNHHYYHHHHHHSIIAPGADPVWGSVGCRKGITIIIVIIITISIIIIINITIIIIVIVFCSIWLMIVLYCIVLYCRKISNSLSLGCSNIRVLILDSQPSWWKSFRKSNHSMFLSSFWQLQSHFSGIINMICF